MYLSKVLKNLPVLTQYSFILEAGTRANVSPTERDFSGSKDLSSSYACLGFTACCKSEVLTGAISSLKVTVFGRALQQGLAG